MPDTVDDVDEHPIIFNEWSINRILAGEKTQTRRIADQDFRMQKAERVWKAQDGTFDFIFEDDTGMLRDCPYGSEGDVLWVREAFRMPVRCDDQYTPKEYISSSGYTHGVPGRFQYEADGKRAYEVAGNRDACAVEWGRKRPSIYMPRELCRLRLRVEDVWVERVQSITPEDAEAEGVDPKNALAPCGVMEISDPFRARFAQVWNDIHGDGAWERNDWVWVTEFSRIDNT